MLYDKGVTLIWCILSSLCIFIVCTNLLCTFQACGLVFFAFGSCIPNADTWCTFPANSLLYISSIHAWCFCVRVMYLWFIYCFSEFSRVASNFVQAPLYTLFGCFLEILYRKWGVSLKKRCISFTHYGLYVLHYRQYYLSWHP